MISIGTEVINRIKELQLQRNWSTNHLAMQAGLTASTLTNWYKRKASPSIPALYKICSAFGISMSDFFDKECARTKLTNEQQELLDEWNLLHKAQKADLLRFLKTSNEIIIKASGPL